MCTPAQTRQNQVVETSYKAVLHSEGTVWFLQSKDQIHFLELNRKVYAFLGARGKETLPKIECWHLIETFQVQY